MSTSEHTKGPWSAANIGDQGWTVLAGDTTVAIVGGGNNGEDFDPAYEADAGLIAAAPDMLEALKAASQRANETGTDALAWQETVFAMRDILNAAIAKAEGR